MTYNRSEILKAAWAEAKAIFTCFHYARHQLHGLFRAALRKAWTKAKEAARVATRSAADLRMSVVLMENTDRLGWDGIERLRVLRDALCEAEAREAALRPAALLMAA